jgi:uncharacterized protein (TIGR01244 family)
MRSFLMTALLFAAAVMPACAAAEGDDHGITNEKAPTEGVLFGGQPSAEQLESIAAAGYRTVIDLRGAGEDRGYDEATAASDAGLDYHHIEVTQQTLSSDAPFDQFLDLFSEAETPVLVHCASGNRVGAMYYTYLVAKKGMDRDEALAEAKAQGLRSDQLATAANRYLDSKGH